jgi:hypothetical protein
MKILFIMRHHTYVRNYDAALQELARRGHQVHLAMEIERQEGMDAVKALAREWPGITHGRVPEPIVDTWSLVSQRLRLGFDYLRYLDPFYDTATLRRERARNRTPRLLIALADPPLLRGERWRRLVGGFLHALDRAVPPPPVIVDFVRSVQPDLVMITPLVDLGSRQIDYLRAARLLGIPTVLPVWSWDHLSSKALLREPPERILVWNHTQRDEAIQVHRVPAARVVVTGAQCFDHWFTRRPVRTREQFCAQLGLPADRPVILYVCTGLIMGSPPEPPFVLSWLQAVRASHDPMVAGAGVLIRPHPSQAAAWEGVDLSAYGPVALWGANPVDDATRGDYFDSLYHSNAVVGLNTSAFIEAGIVGREVLAILPPEFHDNQAGTVHFRYLLNIGGGLLRVSRELEAHVGQLGEALRRPPSAEHPHRVFLESFVRPNGLDVAATPAFVAAIEQMAGYTVTAATPPPAWRRRALGLAAKAFVRLTGESIVRSPRSLNPGLKRGPAAPARQETETP